MMKCRCSGPTELHHECLHGKSCETDSYCVMKKVSVQSITSYFCNQPEKNNQSNVVCSNKMNEPFELPKDDELPEYQLCCNSADFCNENLEAVAAPSGSPGTPQNETLSSFSLIFITVPVVVVLLGLVSCCVYLSKQRKLRRQLNLSVNSAARSKISSSEDKEQHINYKYSNKIINETQSNTAHDARERFNYLAAESYGGSSHDPLLSSSRLPDTLNSKMPGVYLSMRTISSDVQLVESIATGRYGHVYLGNYAGSKVAVKKLPIREEKSWANERQIYSYLRHHSILQFIASDRVATPLVTELWLVVDYHKNGSLFDYLSSPYGVYRDEWSLLRAMTSIAAGLCYLHQHIRGTPPDYKPAIAHCDLKSRNILVKDDLTCCIADFGLAVTPDSFLPSAPDVDARRRRFIIGTRRYCPPDLLKMEVSQCSCGSCLAEKEGFPRAKQTCDKQQTEFVTFEQCRLADIYCVALVFWEMTRRVYTWGVQSAELPFFDHFPNGEPSIEEMYNVVCRKQQRPVLVSPYHQETVEPPKASTSISVFYKIEQLLADCWSQNAAARIPSLLIKKKLDKIAEWNASASEGEPPRDLVSPVADVRIGENASVVTYSKSSEPDINSNIKSFMPTSKYNPNPAHPSAMEETLA